MIHLVIAANVCDRGTFIFLPHWWEYMKTSTDALGQCQIVAAGVDGKFQPTDLLPIGLAVLDILLRLAGFVAVISIIYAGIQHLFTGGNPEKAAAARKRLLSSLVGLVIALIATALVTFIGRQLTS